MATPDRLSEALPVLLTRHMYALVDAEDYPLVAPYRWKAIISGHHSELWYAKTTIDGKLVGMSRFLLNPPADMVVDHINGNGLDNRRCNLRIVTIAENQVNRHNKQYGKSRFVGLYRFRNRWVARIKIDKKYKFLGSFPTEEEAAAAYDVKALELYGDKARLNRERRLPGVAA